MDSSFLREDSAVAYATKMASHARDVKAGRRANDLLGYDMLPWSYHTLFFVDGSKIWRNTAKLERRYRTESESLCFVAWHF